VLSNRAKSLYAYFKQLFAQVTNPPIDPIREEMVMSLVSFIRPASEPVEPGCQRPQLRLEVSQPVLSSADMEKIRAIGKLTQNKFRSTTLGICYPATHGAGGMGAALDGLCAAAEKAVHDVRTF